MAQTIALTLTSNGDDVPGDSTVTSMSRADTIEVLSLEQALSKTFDRATLLATGRRIYTPLKFTKRLDRSTPLLRQALVENRVVAGAFRWYRPNPDASGTTEQFFTLAFTAGRITKCTLRLPDTLDPALALLPPLEDVELTFSTITWTWTSGSVEFEDSLSTSSP
ncbi:type VI secretion system tube protein TssD [Hydrogenophaga sp.]|jgi:type VI secretion system secreted protein Hcp|uniref:type VI secretion system tube protein TssD n=1 Tax=Hydrogenophaga sp. TaxID=1904254 RepID=UPI003F70A967